MPVEVIETKLSATSDGDASGSTRLYDSIKQGIDDFMATTNPTSVDQVSTRTTGDNRCAVIILYTA